MRKIVLVGAGILALVGVASIAGCSSERRYDDYAYNQPQVVQQAPMLPPAPVYVQNQGSFLDRHGDAILAGGAGYLAGKAMSRPSYRPTVINRTYVSPSRPTWSSGFSSRRSSSFGGFRSRRR